MFVQWMRSIGLCERDLAEWLERLAFNAKIATVNTKCQLLDYCG
jgi:hypothetical protein